MNRAQRRAARFTKAGRHAHALATEHICAHGNWMKTDGNGEPMCPHGCGFPSSEQRGAPAARVFDKDMNELDRGPLGAVMRRLTDPHSAVVLMPRQHGRPQTAVTKAIGKFASITTPPAASRSKDGLQ